MNKNLLAQIQYNADEMIKHISSTVNQHTYQITKQRDTKGSPLVDFLKQNFEFHKDSIGQLNVYTIVARPEDFMTFYMGHEFPSHYGFEYSV
ncbi:MAG: hypothetical protein EOP45_18735 [Sphingobacteriaceae bacterium]|nr:MAG: hypothetical protein EOP45_18735 [Sphingobacteriaceae bacterium]